jgi:hypothetical protein
MAMAFVGSMRAGLAYVNVLANMMVSSILGSATAQVAIMSQIMVPEMERKGYDKTFAAGLTAYGGMLGPIIPPSVMFVVYSTLAQVSVGDMLIAGIEPEAKSGWYQGEYSISESRKGAMRMEGSKAFVSRPAMFERFGQMITQEEFTIDLNDGAFVQTLTFRDGTRRHMIKGVCAKYSKAPFQ